MEGLNIGRFSNVTLIEMEPQEIITDPAIYFNFVAPEFDEAILASAQDDAELWGFTLDPSSIETYLLIGFTPQADKTEYDAVIYAMTGGYTDEGQYRDGCGAVKIDLTPEEEAILVSLAAQIWRNCVMVAASNIVKSQVLT